MDSIAAVGQVRSATASERQTSLYIAFVDGSEVGNLWPSHNSSIGNDGSHHHIK